MKQLSLLVACALAGLAAAPACTTEKVTVVPDNGGTPESDGGAEEQEEGDEEGGGGTQCTAARDQLLVPVAKVADAEVKVVSEVDGVATIYVDASAGGFDQARRNPRVYITLAGTKVDVTDKDAPSSSEWDLALKRQVIFTNSGDAGPGKGGGAMIAKDFDAVTAADADAVEVVPESFFDEECNAKTDEISDPVTTFTGWYDYDQASMRASAKPGITFIVKSAAGVRHKVGIVSYTGRPDGSTTSPATGYFLLKVARL